MPRFPRWPVFLWVLLALSLVVALSGRPDMHGYNGNRNAGDVRTVTRVVDGDTLILDGGERVRLIGVDTPETVHPRKPVQCFGREASRFTKRLAQGQTVRLEFDQANAHVSHRDKYHRTLAYVYLSNGLLINREIIRQGYGHAYTHYPFSYLEDFRAAEREARQNGRGLWGACRLAANR